MTKLCFTSDLKILNKYYDIARVIAPCETDMSQPAIVSTSPGHSPSLDQCIHFGEQTFCTQCICLRAIQCKETVMKTEIHQGTICMITAMPLETNNGTIALELIKFISEKTLDNFLNLPQENKKMYRSLARLHDLAFKDALTDIFNRRYIDSQLPQEISQSHHNNEPFSIVMTDIDYFKQVNDQYGHSIGDRVLQYFAAFLQENIDKDNGAWVARYGGEEFLIVLPKCWGQQAYDLTEKIRTAVAAATISTPAGTIHISASFGVHTFSGQECQHQMIDKADKQLYLAKQAGRNCTMMLSP